MINTVVDSSSDIRPMWCVVNWWC